MEQKRIGFNAGSFDPFTKGHLHVVKEALNCYDSIVIGIALDSGKTRRFPVDIMTEAIIKTLEEENLIDRVKVISYSDLTCTNARKEHATHLVRGIRNGMDYEYEENLAKGNKRIGGFETVYFRSDSDLSHISSSIVMQCFKHGLDVSEYVPKPVLEAMINYTKQHNK